MRAPVPQLLKLCFLSLGVSAAAQAPLQIHVDVGLVNVAFSVRDLSGAFVSGLQADDFEVLEDGVPQAVRFFGASGGLPLTVGLVEDFSPSQDRFNRKHRRDTQDFLESVIRPGDQTFLVCFGDNARLVAALGVPPADWESALRRYDRHPGQFPILGDPEKREGGTALFDALFFSARGQMKGLPGRKALLVFSDGEDNSSLRGISAAVEAAQGADALIFSVRTTVLKHSAFTTINQAGVEAMRRLAVETGGRDFDATALDMHTVFLQIGEELRSLYELAYTSTSPRRDGRFRRVEIRSRKPGLEVRARTGYFAK